MTLTTPQHQEVQTDVCIDRHVDARKDDTPPTNAFVIVLANHKGGVTKTTSTANLGACLAEAGRRILVVDCDPQANLSEVFGWTEDLPGERLEDLLAHPAAAVRYATPPALQVDVGPQLEWRDRLRIIPCTDALADVAADLPTSAGDGWESRLREVLYPLRDRFDFVLLDTPPGLGNLSGMAVLAADGLLIPARPADLDVRGAGKLYDLVETSVPDLRILGVLIAASDQRWRIARDASSRMSADQMHVLPIQIPRRAGRLSTPLPRTHRCAGARLDGQPRLPATRPPPPPGARTMSAPEPMPSVRRRPIPGMTSQPVTPAPSAPAVPALQPPDADGPAISQPAADQRPASPDGDSTTGRDAPHACRSDETEQGHKRRPATDYAATRLANFRIPVALLDRYRQLVREAEDRDTRLRRPSVTEVVIGLLQEGPQTPDEVAELIRRKRADEHGLEG